MTEPTPRTVYSFGPYRLRADNLVLERDGRVVPLPPKAVETLLALIESRGELVGKAELMHRVWPGTFVTESSLTRNISAVRKVLHEGGLHDAIETHSKRGYRFAVPVELCAEPRRRPVWLWAAAIFACLLTSAALWRAHNPQPQEALREVQIGRYLHDKLNPADAAKAFAHYAEAVRLSPGSAEAHAGLAAAYVLRAELRTLDSASAFAVARRHAERALLLDKRHPAAHIAYGTALLYGEWDWAGAERAFRRAIELDPKATAAYDQLANLLSRSGRHAEAVRIITAAQALDAASPRLGTRRAIVLYYARRYAEAAQEFRAVLDREPEYALAHYHLGLSLAFLGGGDEALHHLARSRLREGLVREDMAWVHARAGNIVEAAKLDGTGEGQARPSLIRHLALGRHNDALLLAGRWVDQRDSSALNLPADPRLDPLRDRPEFAALVARVLSTAHRGGGAL